jgi:hypothetical protein
VTRIVILPGTNADRIPSVRPTTLCVSPAPAKVADWLFPHSSGRRNVRASHIVLSALLSASSLAFQTPEATCNSGPWTFRLFDSGRMDVLHVPGVDTG